MKDLERVWGRFRQGFGRVFGRFSEGFGKVGAFWALFCSCFGTFLGCLGIFQCVGSIFGYFWLFLLFVVTLGCCGMFLLTVACRVWFFLRIVVCGPFGRHRDLSACFGSFLLCFFHLVAPRGASAASVARHQRGKSRKEERQDEEEAFLKFAWLFLLLLAIAAFY